MANKTVLTKKFRLMLAVTAVTVAIGISGCTIPVGTGEHHDENGVTTSRGEHEREGGNGDGEDSEHASASDGEESGNTLTLTERYDTVRKGTRLVLAYDAQNNAFNGTVENITSSTLQHVRVEVHLSNGVELGPTTPVDLAPGQKVDVTLPATAQAFDGWTPHAEVGPGTGGEAGEHGSGGEDGEDGGNGDGEDSEHASASDGEESGNTLTLTERYDTVRKAPGWSWPTTPRATPLTAQWKTSLTVPCSKFGLRFTCRMESSSDRQRRLTSLLVKKWMLLSPQQPNRLTGGRPTLK